MDQCPVWTTVKVIHRAVHRAGAASGASAAVRGPTRRRRAEKVFGLADMGAQSPPESGLRVRLVLGGLPRPMVQLAIRLPSGLVLHPDLAWEEWKVAVEYDGHWYADPDQLHRYRRRLNQLVTAGWTVLHVTSPRQHNDFPAVLREVKAALTAKGWRPRPRVAQVGARRPPAAMIPSLARKSGCRGTPDTPTSLKPSRSSRRHRKRGERARARGTEGGRWAEGAGVGRGRGVRLLG